MSWPQLFFLVGSAFLLASYFAEGVRCVGLLLTTMQR